jgi:hypothetical protein
MNKLVRLEVLKLKRSSMNVMLLALSIVPILLIIIQYAVTSNQSFFTTVSRNNRIISISIFSVVIIIANYILAREYKERTIIYLFITPKSRTKILLSKYILLFFIILILGALSFGSLFIANALTDGITKEILLKYLGAWLVGSGMFFLLTPVVVYVALVREDFISALLISLVVFIFTCPFMFKEQYYGLPHLIPMVAVNKFLSTDGVSDLNFPLLFLILGVVFLLFLYLSIRRFNRKE